VATSSGATPLARPVAEPLPTTAFPASAAVPSTAESVLIAQTPRPSRVRALMPLFH
jgi:hypothetical protein